MNSKVFRLQSEGVLREQSMPPPVPPYNKYMGAVDLTDQFVKPYGFDRKSNGSGHYFIILLLTMPTFYINILVQDLRIHLLFV